jgi:ABC-2 type transport system ATP-binding protein
VDVELRQAMWNVVRELRESGVTVILTTHYIEEAEQMADRVGVINHGEVVLVKETASLMRELGKKQLVLMLNEPLQEIPPALNRFGLELGEDSSELVYTYDSQRERTGITTLLGELEKEGIAFHDLNTSQSSLEEIFVDLVKRER